MSNKNLANKQVLKFALHRAFANGWDWWLFPKEDWYALSDEDQAIGVGELLKDDAYKIVIYNHDFAKALWGDIEYSESGLVTNAYSHWQHHLQQMVIATNPLEYLARNLPSVYVHPKN